MQTETPKPCRVTAAARLILYPALAALLIVALGGCSTVAGLGQDLTAAAEGLREAMTKDGGR